MKNLLIPITLILFASISSNALSADPTQQLGSCLTDSLNGKERKELAKWIFLGMAAHPEISPFSSATEEDVTAENKYVGQLITRLLTKDCPSQLHQANRSNPQAVQQAFGLVGQVAMQELMTNSKVNEALMAYAQYTDMEEISAVLAEK